MIFLAIVMLSIAMAGLMVIQGYWVFSAYKIRQDNFIRTVNEVAHDVIQTLEKIDMIKRYQEPGFLDEKNAISATDSINQVLLQEMQMITTRKDLEIFFNKFFIARELMEERMLRMDERHHRRLVDISLLDSLLGQGFRQRKLDTEWEFAIFNPYGGHFQSMDVNQYRNELLNAEVSFHFELYPDDMHLYPDFLLLYFPNKKEYLTGQIWPLVAISVVLIVIIILSFIYTLIMFFRQGRLSELKTDFINNMTHEFKTPVSTISLACEALNDKDIQKSEDLYKSYINIISEENRRLGLMAERILQSAALEKGELLLHKEKADLHDILSDVIRNISIQVEIKDGQIVKDFRATDSVLSFDRMHMVNAVQNLLDNANMYSPVKPHILVSTRDASGGIAFTVEDNGIGIGKSDQKKIFDKLYRVPEGNIHNFKGFGLGLSYVKTVVERHGGTVKLESEPRKGTRIEVFLPNNHE